MMQPKIQIQYRNKEQNEKNVKQTALSNSKLGLKRSCSLASGVKQRTAKFHNLRPTFSSVSFRMLCESSIAINIKRSLCYLSFFLSYLCIIIIFCNISILEAINVRNIPSFKSKRKTYLYRQDDGLYYILYLYIYISWVYKTSYQHHLYSFGGFIFIEYCCFFIVEFVREFS